jgi:hypothetical protein
MHWILVCLSVHLLMDACFWFLMTIMNICTYIVSMYTHIFVWMCGLMFLDKYLDVV